MEEQALQTVELMQRDNQLLRQELKGLRQQGAPQQQQQQHTCATCTACAEDHSQNRQQLEDDLERLRQGIERVNEQARLQQEQQLEAEAVEGENCRLRLHLARVMEEARAAQRRCSALLATTTAQGKAIAALKQDNKQLRQAQSTVLQQEETAAVGQGALDKQGGGVRLTDRGTKRLREASVQQRDHPGAAGQDVGIVQTLAPDMESECLKRELARVREEAGAKQRQDMAINMAVIAAQGRKIAALQQDNARLRLGAGVHSSEAERSGEESAMQQQQQQQQQQQEGAAPSEAAAKEQSAGVWELEGGDEGFREAAKAPLQERQGTFLCLGSQPATPWVDALRVCSLRFVQVLVMASLSLS